jgi:hypothetical protein
VGSGQSLWIGGSGVNDAGKHIQALRLIFSVNVFAYKIGPTKLVREKDNGSLKVEPALDELRADDPFQNLLRRVDSSR